MLSTIGRTRVMAIVNVTPDSFSDGGTHYDARTAIDSALRMADEGADIIDVGGESTRPGAVPVTADEEWSRIGSVVGELVRRGIVVSVDTYHSETARRASECGVQIINDVTGGSGDTRMFETVAQAGTFYVLQHSRGVSANESHYDDIGSDVARELSQAQTMAERAGVERSRIILDPGFGFAKNSEQCWDLVRTFDSVDALGMPLLVGVSRKRFVGDVARGVTLHERDTVSAMLAFHYALHGVWAIRAHNVVATREAVDLAARIKTQ